MTQLEMARRCRACRSEQGVATSYCRACGLVQGDNDTTPQQATTRPQQPTTRAMRPAVLLPTRPPTVGLVVVAIVVGAFLSVTVPFLVVRSTLFGPDDVVRRYFAALADRDADRAWARLSADEQLRAGNPLLMDEALRDRGYSPPTGATVSNLDVDGENARLVVRYRVAGAQMAMSLELRRGGDRAGPLNRWHIANGLLPLRVPPLPGGPPLVAGRSLRMDEEHTGSLSAFPGAYAVTLPHDSLLEIPPTNLVAGEEETTTIRPVVKASVGEAIRTKVRELLDGCARSTELEPPGCPFRYYGGYYTVTDVSWEITEEPDIQLRFTEQGQLAFFGEGTAQISGHTDSQYYPDLQKTVQFPVSGTAVVRNEQVTLQLDED